jgi:uncharacterized protein YciW
VTEQVKDDWRKADLSKPDYAMLEYAEKLSLAPSMMNEGDIANLRDAGWSDRDILDIAHVCAYFNFRVRMVDGLGLELGDWQLERSKAGAERAQVLANQRGQAMPADPWGVRAG